MDMDENHHSLDASVAKKFLPRFGQPEADFGSNSSQAARSRGPSIDLWLNMKVSLFMNEYKQLLFYLAGCY